MSTARTVLLIGALVAAATVASAQGGNPPVVAHGLQPAGAVSARASREGLTIDLAVSRTDQRARGRGALREGEDVTVAFTIRDAGSGAPVSSLNPAAWLTLAPSSADAPRPSCSDQARAAISPSFVSRPEVDLNTYYVLALNADATISVVDPLFGFGGSKLLAMVALQSPGEDWALTSDQNRLLVSMPAANRIAVVDTRSWAVVSNVDAGSKPTRVVLQPDEAYAWVTHADSAEQGSVTVLSLRTLRVTARIAAGRGAHRIAFSDDSRYAFIANGDAGTVSIIDVRNLRKIRDVTLGSTVGTIAWSKLARMAYVSLPATGEIVGIDAAERQPNVRIPVSKGTTSLAIAPDGRLAFAIDTQGNRIAVIDTAVARVVRTLDVEHAPDQIAFSNRFAYVRHRDSEIVVLIGLDRLKTEPANASLVDFPGGQHALGASSRMSSAPSIVQSANDNAVLVANPRDRAIYYYQEGMAAPMGQFSNYGREPVAIRIVDRSLRETRPGVYQSLARLPGPGNYDALLVIDSPRVIHCFPLSIEASPASATSNDAGTARVEPVESDTAARAGAPLRIALRMTDARTGALVVGVRDAQLLVVAPGVWQMREALAPEAGGIYALTVTPPTAGLYEVYVACPSRKVPYQRLLAFEAGEAVEEAK